jgi:hypothetical protein
MDPQSLSELLLPWLESQRQRFVAAADHLKLPTAFGDPRSGTLVSIARHPILASQIYRQMATTPTGKDPGPALLSAFGRSRHIPRPIFDQDPLLATRRHILGWLTEKYLCELDDPRCAVPEAANAVVDQVGRYLRSEITKVAFLPLTGLVPATERVQVGYVTLRLLTESERTRLAEPMPDLLNLRLPPPMRRTQMGDHTAAIEIRMPISLPADPENEAARVLLAFQLLGFTPATSDWIQTWEDPGPGLGVMWRPSLLPDNGQEKTVTATEVAEAVALSSLIPTGAVNSPKTVRDVALHRFSLGCSRQAFADRHIDFVIALEAVLLQGQKDELAFRFRTFGALFLSKPGESRREVAAQLKQLYEIRSSLVHGSKFPQHSVVVDAAPRLRDLTAQALVKCLSQGWPTSQTFADQILGE